MKERLKNNKINYYFLDTTYKIIPRGNNKYKLVTMSGVNSDTNYSNLNALVFIKYEDKFSYEMVFRYLNTLYNFNPKVIHIDYANSLRLALTTENLFNKKPIIMHCFSHFCQCIVKQMRKFNIFKKSLTKRAFEILKNIELICFINPIFLNTYNTFLESNLKEENEKKLYKYLNKNWLNKNYNI